MTDTAEGVCCEKHIYFYYLNLEPIYLHPRFLNCNTPTAYTSNFKFFLALIDNHYAIRVINSSGY